MVLEVPCILAFLLQGSYRTVSCKKRCASLFQVATSMRKRRSKFEDFLGALAIRTPRVIPLHNDFHNFSLKNTVKLNHLGISYEESKKVSPSVYD